jgi:nucleoside-diphosphate-sugar epimerase
MKIFVVGATGVLGKRAVARLVEAGHDVSGVARSPEKAELLRGVGATPVTVDLDDDAAVKDAVDGHEVVANLATHIPSLTKMAFRSAWKENDAVRRHLSRRLADAALDTGASRYIQESIAFMYADGGDAWIDEDSPLDVPDYVESGIVAESQARRVTDAGATGIVLRFGGFHTPDSEQTQMEVRAGRRGICPMIGDPDGYLSSVVVDDCAAAVVAALGAPAGIYNVVDDEPLTRREYAAALAAALGKKKLRLPPRVAAKMTGPAGELLRRSERVSNRRFKDATNWTPRYPSMREGWQAVVAQIEREA